VAGGLGAAEGGADQENAGTPMRGPIGAACAVPALVGRPFGAVSAVPAPPVTLFGAICGELLPVGIHDVTGHDVAGRRDACCAGGVQQLTSVLNELALKCGMHAKVVDARVRAALAAMRAKGVAGADVGNLRCGLSRSAFRLVRRKPLLKRMHWFIERICVQHGLSCAALDAAYNLHRADPVVRAAVQGLRGLAGSGAPLASPAACLAAPPPQFIKPPPHNGPVRCSVGPGGLAPAAAALAV